LYFLKFLSALNENKTVIIVAMKPSIVKLKVAITMLKLIFCAISSNLKLKYSERMPLYTTQRIGPGTRLTKAKNIFWCFSVILITHALRKVFNLFHE